MELTTARLTLRPPLIEDLNAGHALASAPETLRFVGKTAPSSEMHWTKSLRDIGHWSVFGYGIFSVIDREDGALIGKVGLSHFSRGLGMSFDPYPEASWVMAARSHGTGMAMEAAQAVHSWFDRQFSAKAYRSVCIIRPDNPASLRIADRLGYRVFDEAVYADERHLMLERKLG